MKKIFTILGMIAATLTAILAILPVSNLAILPGITAIIFGLAAYYLSKKDGHIKKIIPFILYLTLSALTISLYKSVFTKTEVGNTEVLNETEIKSEADAIQELESLDIDLNELEGIDD